MLLFPYTMQTTPQFGTKESDLHECYRNGIIPYGREFETLTTNIRSFCEQVCGDGTRVEAASLFMGCGWWCGFPIQVFPAALAHLSVCFRWRSATAHPSCLCCLLVTLAQARLPSLPR
jgi:hypothetical protein